MLERNFHIFDPHLEGSRVQLSTNQSVIATVGSDDIIFTVESGPEQTIKTANVELRNEEKLEITAMALHPKLAGCFVFGTSTGVVKFLRPIQQQQLHKAQIIFKGDKSISSLSFSASGRHLGIATETSSAIVYSTRSKRLMRLPGEHEGFVNRVYFGRDDYVFSIGGEGRLLLHSMKGNHQAHREEEEQSEDPFEQLASETEFLLMDSYKISTEAVARKYPFLNASFAVLHNNQTQVEIIVAAGLSSLQIIQLSEGQSTYRLERRVYEQREILLVEMLGRGENGKGKTLVAATEQLLSIWNISRFQKIVAIDIKQQLNGMVAVLHPIFWKGIASFVFLVNNTASDGKVYLFNNYDLLEFDEKQCQPVQLIEEQKQREEEKEEKSDSGRHVSISNKLLPCYPQFPLEKTYEEFQGARFLFYNNVGCVIERLDESHQSSTLQLELHDKSKPKRFKIDRNRSFGMFALKEKAFLCATTNLIVFQEQKQIKAGSEGWELTWENIQGLAIGSNWIAVANTQEIRVFDYCANELHCICFDRRFVAMEAYEDLLAIVYHSSPPMWGCQSLKMRVYRVTTFAINLERDVIVPMKPNSVLKWFGFSQEGMICCQDSLEVLRCYSFNRNQWQSVYSLEGKQECLFIQHIEGIDIYGFRLQHRVDQREEPKVLPRSLPRKIPMEWAELGIEFFSKDEGNYLKKIKLRNLMIEHEEYRHQMWFKLKYSRKKEDPWFEHSKTIKSEEEIKTFKMQVDFQLHDYLKKFLNRTQGEGQRTSRIVVGLMLICEREAHYEESKQKLREMLTSGRRWLLPSYYEDLAYRPTVNVERRRQKLNEVNILEQMVSLMREE